MHILKVGVLGLNHKIADLALRETMALAASVLSGEKALFFPFPVVLLSTCNRTEIYFSGEDLAEAHSELLALLRRHFDVPFEHRLYSYFAIDCFTHLCRVTAGLDSAILAETEIQSQVKLAYEKAHQIQKLPPCLHFIFQKALKVGKNIRTDFAFTPHATSLASTIWDIANRWSDDLQSASILFVGYSEINRSLLSYFQKRGVRHITVSSRAAAMSHEWNWTDRSILSRWNEFPILICGAKADGFLIEDRSTLPHLIFDLSVPRNVDPKVAGAKTYLYNIEQLNTIVSQTRRVDVDQMETIVTDVSLRLARLYRERRASSFCASSV